jgi:serine/threonine protein kinase
MISPLNAVELLDVVRQKAVVDEDILAAYLKQHPTLPHKPSELAQQMVTLGLLTPYQARQLVQGRHKRIVLGQYRLLERIGKGGHGRIYLAEHLHLRRRVALKVLPAGQAGKAEVLERFYREARAVAVLDHPNIVRAFDANHVGKIHFLVLEFVEGVTLKQLLQNGEPLSYPLAANYMTQVAAGLEHAWKRGLVHRDIKPSNLIVDRQGVVKILDLGLARFFQDGEDSLTQEHSKDMLVGTPDYLSPEQADDSDNVDIRADLYSLGSTFYTLLHGKPPFHGCNLSQKLIHHRCKVPPCLHVLHPEIPRELSNIVARLMAKKPEERYQTPGEMVAALDPFVRGKTATLEDFCLDDTLRIKKSALATVKEKAGENKVPWFLGAAMGMVGLGLWWLGGSAAPWMP